MSESTRERIEDLAENGFQALTQTQVSTIVSDVVGAGEELVEFPFEQFLGVVPQFSAIDGEGLDFTVTTVNAAGEEFDAIVDLVTAVTAAAIENFSEIIFGATGAVLDVGVAIADLGPGTVASAGSTSLFFGDDDLNGFVEILTGSQIEFATGIDPNGETSDISITVSTAFIQAAIDAGTLDASFSIDPDREIPAGVLDFVSVLTHEVFHGLGFFSFRNAAGGGNVFDLGFGPVAVESTYGAAVEFNVENGFLTPRFTGENVVEVYGDAVVLETTIGPGSDISHFAAFNPDGSLADTVFDIENPFVIAGDIVTFGALDLALLNDIGFDTVEDDRGLLNTLDFVDPALTPTVSVASELTEVNGQLVATVSLTNQLFTSVPSSVGLEITAADGTTQTQRVIFTPGDLETTVVLSEDLLGAIASDNGDVSLRLFFPAQAELGNGLNEETITIDVSDVVGGSPEGEVISNSSGTTNGDDEIIAGNGDDRIVANNGDDLIFANGGDDTVSAGNGDDIISGGSGDDRLDGGRGDDVITGGTGDDLLIGRNGDDILNGSAGSDLLVGGRGDDEFTFSLGDAGDADVVNDFRNGDTLVFEDIFASFDEFIAAAVEVGNNVVVTLDAATDQIVTLRNTDLEDLNDTNVDVGAVVLELDDDGAGDAGIIAGDLSIFATASSSGSSLFSNAKESDIDFDLFRTTTAAASVEAPAFDYGNDAQAEFFALTADFLF